MAGWSTSSSAPSPPRWSSGSSSPCCPATPTGPPRPPPTSTPTRPPPAGARSWTRTPTTWPPGPAWPTWPCARADPTEALELLRPVETDPEVAVLLASARLAAEAADPASRFAAAAAQAADGQADPALATLLDAVREGPGETRDKARELMLDVFRLLGDDHPLTAVYRKSLTRALF